MFEIDHDDADDVEGAETVGGGTTGAGITEAAAVFVRTEAAASGFVDKLEGRDWKAS